MRLYLVQVETMSASDIRFGDKVTKGQKLGMDAERRTEILSPADGVIRHISLECNGLMRLIHIVSRDDEEARVKTLNPL